jgi:hypothetical protein
MVSLTSRLKTGRRKESDRREGEGGRNRAPSKRENCDEGLSARLKTHISRVDAVPPKLKAAHAHRLNETGAKRMNAALQTAASLPLVKWHVAATARLAAQRVWGVLIAPVKCIYS